MADYGFHGVEGFVVNEDGDLRQFVPTLFIGLGGTGKDILMRFRKRLYDEYGMANEKFATFLVIDTDDQSDVPQGEKPEAYNHLALRRNEGEFIKCTIDPAAFKGILSKVRDEHDRRYLNWLHPQVEQLIPPGALEKGAGTYRQAGRLSFFRKYDNIRAQIIKHFRDMLSHATTHPETVFNGRPGQVYDDRLEVVIITSLAGGTGSGMFIDVAYLVRHILETEPDFGHLESSHSTLIAILPTIFAKSDSNLAGRFRQNAYASLLEMEYYTTPRPDENPFLSESERMEQADSKMVEFKVNWDNPQRNEQPIRTHAWDTCYLIDDVNDRRRSAAQTPAGVFQMVADYLFLDFGTSRFALAKRSARSNHMQLRDRMVWARVYETSDAGNPQHALGNEAPILFENRYGCTFSSFGLAEIFIDKDRIDRSASYRLASRLVLGRWLGNAKDYGESRYEEWAKEDLQSGRPPEGETESISFHPDDMWHAMLKDDKDDWLAKVDQQFDHLDSLDPDEGESKLVAALAWHEQQLMKSASSTGMAGAARMTLDRRLEELRGSAARPGKLPTRLKRLARQRFNRVGVMPTLEVLKVYRRAFERAAERAKKQKNTPTPSNQELLARLVDARQVPFVCRRIARSIEYKRACREARAAVKLRYAAAAGENLEVLCNALRAFVGSDEPGAARQNTSTLFDHFNRLRGFFEDLQAQLDQRFDELQHIVQSDRSQSLAPEWSKKFYDEETDAILLLHEEIGHDRDPHAVNWVKADREVMRNVTMDEQGRQISLAELAENWAEEIKSHGGALPEIAEQLSRACRRVLGDGVRLDQFANGNVSDYLVSWPEKKRENVLETMVDSSDPYYPMIRDFKVAVPPAYRNLFGRGSSGPGGQRNVAQISQEVDGISRTKNPRHAIDRNEEGPPTSLIVVREMGGMPLHYYDRLRELERDYHSDKYAQWRKTCHIRFRENFEDLPDIDLIDGDLIRSIRENVDYVLWCFLLRTIRADNEGDFIVEVPDSAFGQRTVRLGARISRIIKHASQKPNVRIYLQRRWETWQKKATPTHMAVLYSAIKQTLERFPTITHARADIPDPPIFNCYKRLLLKTGEFLKETDDGRRWHKILHEMDKLDDDYDAWREQYERVSKAIREQCLVEASEGLPLYQINEKRIPEIQLPGASATGAASTAGGRSAFAFEGTKPLDGDLPGNGDGAARHSPASPDPE